MTQKKPRKSLDDALAHQFVYGKDELEPAQKPEGFEPDSKPVRAEKRKEPDLMSKLETPPKEPTVRLTVDLPESMHRRLSVMAALTGRKKAEIVRFLLDEALKDVGE